MKNSKLTIIAGPCSIDYNNIKEVLQLLDIEVNGKRAVAGVRVVGLKSRTKVNTTAEGMGIDYQAIMENLAIVQKGGSFSDLKPFPSIELAMQIIQKANIIIATETMMPMVQLPVYEKFLGNATLMPWNPSVDQFGWHTYQMGLYAGKNNWHVGLKNGKWVGEAISLAESENFTGQTSIERTWKGLVAYAKEGIKQGNLLKSMRNNKELSPQDTKMSSSQLYDSTQNNNELSSKNISKNKQPNSEIYLIQRGVDIPEKGSYRNYPIHKIAKRVKLALATSQKLLFDPSHSLGPKLKDKIVEATVEAMKMKIDEHTYLYDGILIEVGTSVTDTAQHITLKEFENLVKKLANLGRL